MTELPKLAGNLFENLGGKKPEEPWIGDYFVINGTTWVIVGKKGNRWIVAQADGSTKRVPEEVLFNDRKGII